MMSGPERMDPHADKQITADHWSENVAGSSAFSPEVYWLAVPAVQKRHQARATAGSGHSTWVQYCIAEFLAARAPAERMLSIGCGGGALERDLYRLQAFRHCDAVDLSSTAIEIARREANEIGASTIRYQVSDIEQNALPSNHYDAVWFNGSLHHVRELESVCRQVRDACKPDGWLFFNEYVGANHFGFGPAQRDAIVHAFNLIPEHFRRSFVAGSVGMIQRAVPLPDPAEVARVDPSEAVRSQDIMNVVKEYFDIRVANPSGGSLLQFVLHGIAGNFREDSPDSMKILRMLFAIEDALIDSGSLASDFVVVAAKPRK